ncbi:MAG: peptidoglycan DD-metalloendopeptidase family protein [Clostridiales bacterium]|nr:peptidoglycan DD-metalloendopeptidase family protein [Clostridiales bacterium]
MKVTSAIVAALMLALFIVASSKTNMKVLAADDMPGSSVMAESDIFLPLYVISVDGVEMGAVGSESDCSLVMSLIASHYDLGFEAKPYITSNITYEGRLMSIRNLFTASELAEKIISMKDSDGKPFVKVTQENTTCKTETIPFKSVTEYDNTKYLDYRLKKSIGVNGSAFVTTCAIYENGSLVKVEEDSQVLCSPVTEVYVEGTMEIPYWRATGEFIQPVINVRKVTSRFGQRGWRLHPGIDLAGKKGEEIMASDSGTVIYSGWLPGYGRTVTIDHENGYITHYAHCHKLIVEEGDHVVKGDVIALLGNTGNSTGPHLHFEIRKGEEPLDPEKFIDFVAEI